MQVELERSASMSRPRHDTPEASASSSTCAYASHRHGARWRHAHLQCRKFRSRVWTCTWILMTVCLPPGDLLSFTSVQHTVCCSGARAHVEAWKTKEKVTASMYLATKTYASSIRRHRKWPRVIQDETRSWAAPRLQQTETRVRVASSWINR